VIPNDAVVGVRDVLATAVALGLSEDEAQKRVDAMRQQPRLASNTPAQPQGNGNGEGSGAKASTPNGTADATNAQRSDARGRGGESVAPSGECQAIMRKVRAARETGTTLSEEDRAKSRQCFSQMGGTTGGQPTMGGPRPGGNQGGRGGPGAGRGGRSFGGGAGRARATSRPAVVFVPTPSGPEPRSVMLGYSDLDYTEVLSGLKAGEQVYLVTAARLLQQQQENLERMRQRMQGPVPGMSTPQGGRGPGGR
jgi:hypothetical protein